MSYGPVPSKIDDIFKAVRGDSFFSDCAGSLKTYFHFVNKFVIEPNRKADMHYLSETDIECLNRAILKCKDKTFNELVDMSHDMAWNNTRKNREMSVKDILRENGESEEYAEYISSKLQEENAFYVWVRNFRLFSKAEKDKFFIRPFAVLMETPSL